MLAMKRLIQSRWLAFYVGLLLGALSEQHREALKPDLDVLVVFVCIALAMVIVWTMAWLVWRR